MRGKLGKLNLLILIRIVLLITLAVFVCGCRSNTTISEKSEMEQTLSNEYYVKGRTLLEEGKPEEAIEFYLAALEDIDNNYQTMPFIIESVLNNIYSSLSEAYYQLYEYELSLEYIEKAFEIMPNEYYEYINRGNSFYSLGRSDEAEADYLKALSLNENAKYAIYGLGGLYYDSGRYEEALVKFQKYREYDEADMDAILYILDCYEAMGSNEDGLAFVDEMLVNNSTNYDLLKSKGEFLQAIRSYEEAESYYKELMKTHDGDMEVSLLLGEFYYYNSKYKNALTHFKELSEATPSDERVARWVINCYEALDDYDGAMDYYQAIIENGYESYEIYEAIGDLHLNSYRYMEAIPYFEEAIRINSEDASAHINILFGLYCGKRYSRCIEYGKSVMKNFSSEVDIPWYIGECYYALSDYEEAMKYFRLALELDQNNEGILADAAEVCLRKEDYEEAEVYAEQCLKMNEENEIALSVIDSIALKQNPIGKQLEMFIKDSYLYSDDFTSSEDINEIFVEDDISNTEITKAIEKIKQPDDMFTFVIHDEEYDTLSDLMAEEIEYRVDGNSVYLRINGFYTNTDNNVIEILDSIEDTENKTLIFDLRDNTGGLTDCANNILDVLLGDCVTSTLISKEGYTYNYYSDASRLKFKKIYIFVNGYTASASELLTLGLKTYLNNVTIVGSKTYGKGVGQIVFEDKERKLMVYLVNHYWNVREQNIMSTSITPDVKVNSDKLEDYMKKVK